MFMCFDKVAVCLTDRSDFFPTIKLIHFILHLIKLMLSSPSSKCLDINFFTIDFYWWPIEASSGKTCVRRVSMARIFLIKPVKKKRKHSSLSTRSLFFLLMWNCVLSERHKGDINSETKSVSLKYLWYKMAMLLQSMPAEMPVKCTIQRILWPVIRRK